MLRYWTNWEKCVVSEKEITALNNPPVSVFIVFGILGVGLVAFWILPPIYSAICFIALVVYVALLKRKVYGGRRAFKDMLKDLFWGW